MLNNLSSGGISEVIDTSLETFWVVPQKAQVLVASTAKKSSYAFATRLGSVAAAVVVVYGQILTGAVTTRIRSADGTNATLGIQDRVVLFFCNAVCVEKPRSS